MQGAGMTSTTTCRTREIIELIGVNWWGGADFRIRCHDGRVYKRHARKGWTFDISFNHIERLNGVEKKTPIKEEVEILWTNRVANRVRISIRINGERTGERELGVGEGTPIDFTTENTLAYAY